MAIFGKNDRSALQRALQGQWRSEQERREVFADLGDDDSVRAEDLVPLLASTDAATRHAAGALFTGRVDLKGIQRLLQDLPQFQGPARSSAVRLLSRLRPEVLGPPLDAMLRETVDARRRLGWEIALEVRGPARLAWVERCLREGPPALRPVALQRALGEGHAEAMRPLLLASASDRDDAVRTRAVEALSTLRPDAQGELAGVLLERFLRDGVAVRTHAARGLRACAAVTPDKLRPLFLRALFEGPDATRPVLLELLFATGQPEIVLNDILQAAAGADERTQHRVVDALRAWGPRLTMLALPLLASADERLRNLALRLCEHLDDPRVSMSSLYLLRSGDAWNRGVACDTLGRFRDDAIVPHLAAALRDDAIRPAALQALGRMGTEGALRQIVALLREASPTLRRQALLALSDSRDPRVARAMERVAATDADEGVRACAARALTEFSQRPADEWRVRTSRLPPGDTQLDALLADARARGASDVHVTVGEPPMVRVNGELHRLDARPLDAATTDRMVRGALDAARAAAFDLAGEVDFCHPVPGGGRFRANAFVQRRGVCATFRAIPERPPTLAELRLPSQLGEVLDYHQGIILVTGPSGSGKSTTLAAIINLVNESRRDHVITLEDPIEFVHPPKAALINQREVGRHTGSFARALRAALRQDPDVIMVGEMRDTETIRMALMAAETGHLVIATMHTTSAVGTVDKLIESFPPEEQAQVRMGLSESLKFVVSQSLVPRADGRGRVAAVEVLKGTANVGTLIRDAKTFQLPSLMTISRAAGMQTLDQSLEDLVDAGIITAETAWSRAERREVFEARLAEGTAA
ncbi:MAG: PilT/PilU family type 4a pilus ATPase [Polyangiales bacterium]